MSREPEEPFLFDLPLSPPPPVATSISASGETPRAEASTRRSARRSARPESLPLFGDAELAAAPPEPATTAPAYAALPVPPPAAVAPARGPVPVPRPVEHEDQEFATGSSSAVATATMSKRLRAACGDLAILLSAGAVAAVGATLLGAELGVNSLPALLVFLLSFSFLYCVVSLAFWGQTPGMAWSGLIARSEETEPLSFGQTALRWLGHWLTWALLGLPGLLALSGRSLADRLSGSSTYETPLSGSPAA
ncbi:MAG: RDD family protein [Thermoanaerobaculia bacterium]|nr:RDD family protein [Thermoanaerobaculia bacterium]